MKKLLLILTFVLFSFGANAGLFHNTPVGKKNDVILEIWSDTLNEWVEVILVFGYDDDFKVCEEIKSLFKKRYYNTNKYRCTSIR